MNSSHILVKVLRDPTAVQEFTDLSWERLLVLTERAKVTASLGYRIEQAGLWEKTPARVRARFCASRNFAEFRNRQILWEIDCLERALREVEFEVVALKGGAYLLLGMPWATRRLPADLDVLVAREHLPAMESLLLAQGWKLPELSLYDQRYYREWMHELPPMRHPERGIEVDVHHALLPNTARFHADPRLLWSAAQVVPGSRLKVLGPEDMILHAVVHLFCDSDLDNRLRDLLDIDELLRWFSANRVNFWHALVNRAKAHGIERPLAYALHYSRWFLATPAPEDLPLPKIDPRVRAWMDFLVSRSIFPIFPGELDGLAVAARWLLYVRSHYLRMPLKLLVPHLLYKIAARE